MSDWIEITATAMNPDWLVFDRGTPGTIAHRLGGTLWCTRCFSSPVTREHVCSDITGHSRRWVRTGLAPPG